MCASRLLRPFTCHHRWVVATAPAVVTAVVVTFVVAAAVVAVAGVVGFFFIESSVWLAMGPVDLARFTSSHDPCPNRISF